MSRLKELLHVAPTSTRNTQHAPLCCCVPVAQHVHTMQQTGNDAFCADGWQEFESLLAIVGPAYNTLAHEYELICEAARRDLPAALSCYQIMAKQVRQHK